MTSEEKIASRRPDCLKGLPRPTEQKNAYLDHRGPRQSMQSVRNLKDLYGNITRFVFKAKYRDNGDISLQNKR